MADLVFHVGTAILARAITRRPGLATFVVGVTLPDLGGRVPGLALALVDQAGIPVPAALVYGFGVLHMPAGMFLGSVLLALAFREDQRRRALGDLFAGCLLHLGVDLMQTHFGPGYVLLFPVSLWHWEAGLVGSEATVPFAVPLFAFALLAYTFRVVLPARRARASVPR